MEANQNNDTPSNNKPVSTGEETRFLRVFYKAAITLAFLALLLSASYLFYYLYKSPNPGDITNPTTMASFNADRRMTLISTAFFVALAFGFLGFALFLINAKGEIEGEGNIGVYYGDTGPAQTEYIGPGITESLGHFPLQYYGY